MSLLPLPSSRSHPWGINKHIICEVKLIHVISMTRKHLLTFTLEFAFAPPPTPHLHPHTAKGRKGSARSPAKQNSDFFFFFNEISFPVFFLLHWLFILSVLVSFSSIWLPNVQGFQGLILSLIAHSQKALSTTYFLMSPTLRSRSCLPERQAHGRVRQLCSAQSKHNSCLSPHQPFCRPCHPGKYHHYQPRSSSHPAGRASSPSLTVFPLLIHQHIL